MTYEAPEFFELGNAEELTQCGCTGCCCDCCCGRRCCCGAEELT